MSLDAGAEEGSWCRRGVNRVANRPGQRRGETPRMRGAGTPPHPGTEAGKQAVGVRPLFGLHVCCSSAKVRSVTAPLPVGAPGFSFSFTIGVSSLEATETLQASGTPGINPLVAAARIRGLSQHERRGRVT